MAYKNSILLASGVPDHILSGNRGPIDRISNWQQPRFANCLFLCCHGSTALEAVASGDSLDWKELPASEITQRVTSKVQPGSIVLFHNAALHTPEALPVIIEALLQEGYSFVPISQLLLTCEYTIDHTGRQCPANV